MYTNGHSQGILRVNLILNSIKAQKNVFYSSLEFKCGYYIIYPMTIVRDILYLQSHF
jgi:hypothetical protein